MNARMHPSIRRNHLAARLAVGVALLLLGAIVMFAASGGVVADDAHQSKIYDSSSFEAQPFAAGGLLLGVDGWSTAIPPFLNPEAATITRADSSTGRQSVEVWGGDMIGSEGITAPYDAVGSYRRPLDHEVTPLKPIVVMEADLLLETDEAATEEDFFSMTIAARSGDGETLGEIGLSSSGLAVAYGFNAPPGSTPLFDAPIEFNQWHHVSIVMDFAGEKTNVAYFVDGKLIGAMPTESTSDVLLRGAMVVQALPDGDEDTRANYTARYDNFRVSVWGNGD